MLPLGFESAIPAGEWLQTLALDRSATGIGYFAYLIGFNIRLLQQNVLFQYFSTNKESDSLCSFT
jgi:hypothetical protein